MKMGKRSSSSLPFAYGTRQSHPLRKMANLPRGRKEMIEKRKGGTCWFCNFKGPCFIYFSFILISCFLLGGKRIHIGCTIGGTGGEKPWVVAPHQPLYRCRVHLLAPQLLLGIQRPNKHAPVLGGTCDSVSFFPSLRLRNVFEGKISHGVPFISVLSIKDMI